MARKHVAAERVTLAAASQPEQTHPIEATVTRSSKSHPAREKKRPVGRRDSAGHELAKPNPTRPNTKLATIIAALTKPKGATISDLMTMTGWQAHSVRGCMSGALKKKLRLNVVSEVAGERGRVYRIVAEKAAKTK